MNTLKYKCLSTKIVLTLINTAWTCAFGVVKRQHLCWTAFPESTVLPLCIVFVFIVLLLGVIFTMPFCFWNLQKAVWDIYKLTCLTLTRYFDCYCYCVFLLPMLFSLLSHRYKGKIYYVYTSCITSEEQIFWGTTKKQPKTRYVFFLFSSFVAPTIVFGQVMTRKGKSDPQRQYPSLIIVFGLRVWFWC